MVQPLRQGRRHRGVRLLLANPSPREPRWLPLAGLLLGIFTSPAYHHPSQGSAHGEMTVPDSANLRGRPPTAANQGRQRRCREKRSGPPTACSEARWVEAGQQRSSLPCIQVALSLTSVKEAQALVNHSRAAIERSRALIAQSLRIEAECLQREVQHVRRLTEDTERQQLMIGLRVLSRKP